jgi:hypothetical protein
MPKLLRNEKETEEKLILETNSKVIQLLVAETNKFYSHI